MAADLVFGDPARLHPVAGLGALATRVESALHPWPPEPGRSASAGSDRVRGILLASILVGGLGASVWAVEAAAARRPGIRVAVTALTVWSCHGGTSLLRIAGRHAHLLERGDLDASRRLLPWLCGRDPDGLDADALARAVVESVAENTSDAAVATVFWAAVAGPAGAAVHRVANTLDAMVGHRSERYLRFGWAPARLDDVLGWPAARATGLLTVALAPVVGGRPREAAHAWHADAGAHPSPNAGVVEATCAGALGVRLGGRTVYPYGAEDRPVLGGGRDPRPADVRRAVRLMRAVQVSAAGAAVTVMMLVGEGLLLRPGRRGPQVRSRSARRNARRLSASLRCP